MHTNHEPFHASPFKAALLWPTKFTIHFCFTQPKSTQRKQGLNPWHRSLKAIMLTAKATTQPGRRARNHNYLYFWSQVCDDAESADQPWSVWWTSTTWCRGRWRRGRPSWRAGRRHRGRRPSPAQTTRPTGRAKWSHPARRGRTQVLGLKKIHLTKDGLFLAGFELRSLRDQCESFHLALRRN